MKFAEQNVNASQCKKQSYLLLVNRSRLPQCTFPIRPVFRFYHKYKHYLLIFAGFIRLFTSACIISIDTDSVPVSVFMLQRLKSPQKGNQQCVVVYGDESKRWEKICHSQNQCVGEQRATRPPSGQRVELHPLSPNGKNNKKTSRLLENV